MAVKNIEGTKRTDALYVTDLSVVKVEPGFNAREDFDMEKLQSLKDSILAVGQLTPVVLRKLKNVEPGAPSLAIIAGERRYRAICALREEGHEINLKAVTVQATDQEAALLMAVDNLDREDFTPVEESNLVKRFATWGWDDEEIAKRLGKSPAWVAYRRKFSEAGPGLREAFKASGTNGKSVRFDVVADIAAGIPEDEQVAALETVQEVAEAEAAEASERTGTKIKPNMRRVANQLLGRKNGKLTSKELRGVQAEFMARMAEHEDALCFSAEEVAAVFCLATGDCTPKEFWKMIKTGLVGAYDEVPDWFRHAKLPTKKARKTKKD